MIRLVHHDFRLIIELKENIIPVLIIEQPSFFRKYTAELQQQALGQPGGFVLSEDWVPQALDKHLSFVTDVFSLELNGRKQLTCLHKEMAAMACCEKHFLATCQLKADIVKWLAQLETGFSFPLSYDEDIDTAALLKAANLCFDAGGLDVFEKN